VDKPNDNRILGWAARRAEQRSSFLAAPLAAYRSIHGVAEEQLADFLACTLESLPTLALCKRPDSNEPSFKGDVEQIAGFVGASSVRLGQLLREVEAIEALRGGAAGSGEQATSSGLLAAARDAHPEESEVSGDADDREEQREGEEP
jgi:hypothetical protein